MKDINIYRFPFPLPCVVLKILRSKSTVTLPLTSILSMADKPSRALVLYGDGLARFVSPSHAYFHSLARLAACGFLALPNAPPSESEDERVVRELAVLLDASEWPIKTNGNSTVGDFQKDSIPNKFMGMKAAIVTTHSIVKPLCEKLGVTTLDFQNLVENIQRMPLITDSVASELLHLLGFQDGKTMETSEFDVLFVHVGRAIVLEIEGKTVTLDCLEFLSDLVGSILHKAEPGSEIGSRLHLSLVMSYGDVLPDEEFSWSVLKTTDEKNPHLSLLFPLQSYTMRGEKPRNNVRHYSPMLIAQWQYAVTRKDMAESFSFTDFKENGGNLVIPADRFLHEVAFKLWKAPKYGA